MTRRDAVIPALGPREAAIHRRFFLGAIAVVLTAGATWGAWILLGIGEAGSFVRTSVFAVNAHGHAQIFGWMGLPILGVALALIPRLWGRALVPPAVAATIFLATLAGIVIRTVGMAMAGASDMAIPLAMAGGALEFVAVVAAAAAIARSFRRSGASIEPWIGFVFAGLCWFIIQTVADVWHSWTTMSARSVEELVAYVATYQAPLRDLQIHGLALSMILGMSLRLLPPLFGVPKIADRRAWAALALVTVAVIAETVLFVAYRWSGNHLLAAALEIPWLMLVAGAALVAWPWRFWRPLPVRDRSAKFVRAAFCWLFVSFAMLILMPAYQAANGQPFSHAYFGAIRHAITVGFVSMSILGMGARILPALEGRDARALGTLDGPFLLLNLGCFLRVSLQTLTDWHPAFFALVGVSGILEVAALGWWGAHIAAVFRAGRNSAVAENRVAVAA